VFALLNQLLCSKFVKRDLQLIATPDGKMTVATGEQRARCCD
jgi:hypothetical protein